MYTQDAAERESSYEERWEDMLSILDLQSVLEGDTVSEVDTDWDWQNASSSSSLALMQNVSMTQPIASSSTVLVAPSGENLAFSCTIHYPVLIQLHVR